LLSFGYAFNSHCSVLVWGTDSSLIYISKGLASQSILLIFILFILLLFILLLLLLVILFSVWRGSKSSNNRKCDVHRIYSF